MIDYMKYQGGDEKENKHIQELINLDIKFIYSNAIWFKRKRSIRENTIVLPDGIE